MCTEAFTTTLDAPTHDIVFYCYYRVCEVWPQALLLTSCEGFNTPEAAEPHMIRRPQGLLPQLHIPCCRIYRSEDLYLSELLLGCETPHLQIVLDGDSVEITPHAGADDAVQLLQRLPIWAHAVRPSGRLGVVDEGSQSVC